MISDQRRSVVVVEAKRTPVGRAHKGSLTELRPDDLAAGLVDTVRDLVGADMVPDELVCGCAYPWGEQGYNVGRAIALLSSLPTSVPAHTIARMCASSLEAVRSAGHAIGAGESDYSLVVGVESVSRVGRDRHLAPPNPRWGESGVPNYMVTMIETAENVADRFGITREEMDSYAQRSQDRALAAIDSGYFAGEIVPVATPGGTVTRDDGPRPSSSLEKLAGLESVGRPGGPITAGNSSPLNDGAVAVALMEEQRAVSNGLKPSLRLISSAVVGIDPEIMGMGPVEACRIALRRARLTMDQIDVFELNEAFASQVIGVARELDIDPFDDRLNPHGGAIAIGHPFGMSGARLVTTTANALTRLDGRYGLISLCVGGGQGQAMVVERVA